MSQNASPWERQIGGSAPREYLGKNPINTHQSFDRRQKPGKKAYYTKTPEERNEDARRYRMAYGDEDESSSSCCVMM
jgi:hypothetical protein